MSAYRFWRTDDIALLTEALNHCWLPHVPGEAPVSPAAFKRAIRDLQVWCSSCMVALSGSEPVGVLVGAKRPSATLVYRIAVHPDHQRRGHGRHLLESLGSKLAILGPRRIVAEVPEAQPAACGLFSASGYLQEALVTDYVLRTVEDAVAPARHASLERACGAERAAPDEAGERFMIPVTVDDLVANGVNDVADSRACWARSTETLVARKDDIEGLAVASEERIEAYLLYGPDGEILSLRSLVKDGRAHLTRLIARLRTLVSGDVRFSKVHPDEMAPALAEGLGLHPVATHRVYATHLRVEAT